jgi:RNA polymerase sigma-70 factor (ECF subfamily)
MSVSIQSSHSELLAASAAGDEAAFAALVEEFRALVWGLARALVGQADADDVTQAVFLLLWRKADRVARQQRPVADWLLAATRKVAANHRRAEARRRRREGLVA